MAILKKINFGNDAHDIAKTVVTAKSGGVMSVAAPINSETSQAFTNGDDEPFDYHYELDVNVDNSTIVKSGNKLAVGTVPAVQVSVADSGNKFKAENVEAALSELKEDIASTGSAAKTYKIVEVAEAEAANTSLKEYKVQVAVGSGAFADDTASAKIVVPKDQHLKNVELVTEDNEQHTGQFLKYTYVLNTGAESDVYVDVSSFLTQSEFGDGLEVSSAGVVSVKIDPTSEKDTQAEPAAFLTVSADGIKISGINDEIGRKIDALNVVGTVEEGQYVSSVSETKGIVSTTKANVSDAKLNGYAKGSDATAVAASDTINKAISKLENQVDKAKAAATTKVVKDNAATHLTLTGSTAADGSTTYTIGESDIASKTALDAEIAARKAVDGQDGQTYVVNGDTNYISDATSLNNADVKLDAALKAEETRAKAAENEIASKVGLTGEEGSRTFASTQNYGNGSTSVVDNMQKIDTALKAVSDKADAIQYKVNGTTLEFFGISPKTV